MEPLDIWKSDFRVILSSSFRERIREKIAQAGGISAVCRLLGLTKDIVYQLLNGKSSANQHYRRLAELFNIEQPEDFIVGVTYNGSSSIYPFIKEPNIHLFRIISHVVGDGARVGERTCRWIQRDIHSHWLANLILSRIGFSPGVIRHGQSCCAVTITPYFAMLAQHMFKISLHDLKTSNIVRKVLLMEKDYQLQFLTALIVDEGHIRYKKARSLIVSQINKQFMELFSLLLTSLGYDHSPVKEEIAPHRTIYRINIYANGVLKYYKDLCKQIEEYGDLVGLWHKQEAMEDYIRTLHPDIIKYSKMQKDYINKKINFILDLDGFVSYDRLRGDTQLRPILEHLSKSYLVNKFYEKVKNGKLVRLDKGVYTRATAFPQTL